MKNQSAITLVALIITIIVLLILAIVSINLVINSRIISKTKTATEIYSIEELKEQLYLKELVNDEEILTGKLSDLDLDISQDLINNYDDILYVKDGKLYLSFIAEFPDSELYKNNKDKIEKFKNLEICYDSLKAYNRVVNPYFNDGLNGYSEYRGQPPSYMNTSEIINENNNNYLHIEQFEESGKPYAIYQNRELANKYDDIIYINVKYRNNYINTEENHIINSPISISKVGGGYTLYLLNKDDYISNYKKGWKCVSAIRQITENYNSKSLRIKFGGDVNNSLKFDYIIDIDDIYAINLTEIFGAGNEPTKEQMDEIFNNF